LSGFVLWCPVDVVIAHLVGDSSGAAVWMFSNSTGEYLDNPTRTGVVGSWEAVLYLELELGDPTPPTMPDCPTAHRFRTGV
jgi:hypothetical protein